MSAMEGIREEILDVLREDYRAQREQSILVSYLREESESDPRVVSARLLAEERHLVLQGLVVRWILENPKITDLRKVKSLTPLVGEHKEETLRKANDTIRKRLNELGDIENGEQVPTPTLRKIIHELEPYLPRVRPTLALMIEEANTQDGPQKIQLTKQITQRLTTEAKQWLLDRGASPSNRISSGNVRVFDIPLELAARVLARHKEIHVDDDEFDAEQAFALWQTLCARQVASYSIPIRVNALTGVGLYLFRDAKRKPGFYVFGKGLPSLGSPRSAEIIKDEYFMWLDENPLANQGSAAGIPERYRWFFDTRTSVNIKEARAIEARELEQRRRKRKVRA